MGELFAVDGVRAVGAGLNDMFSQTNIRATRDRVSMFRANGFPGLLHRRANAGGAPSRQLTLRFAAWLLTSHIRFSANDPSRANFRDWLRWLTWLKKEHPRAHNRIRNIIEENLAKPDADIKPMVFTWSAVDNEDDFRCTITAPTGGTDFYVIEVLAKDGPSVQGTEEDDPTQPPAD